MNTYKIIFWISTGLFSAFMLFSVYNYLTSEELKGAFTFLGFPDYFRIELAIAKLLGALALIFPFVPKPVKTAAYIGFTINIISAIVAHIAKDYHSYGPIVFSVVVLALSYYSYVKLQSPAENNNSPSV
ncbi:MAG: DoxX family protein [Flavobacteriaceae bacterium]|jgi:hypothetical protein|nr:DoxX family protein [Flavobacteriaceae bacterium]